MNQNMTHEKLRKENQVFAGTGGVSQGNGRVVLFPAFMILKLERCKYRGLKMDRPRPCICSRGFLKNGSANVFVRPGCFAQGICNCWIFISK